MAWKAKQTEVREMATLNRKRFIAVVRVLENTRSIKDARRRVDRYICEYRDDDNVEYRRGHEVPVGSVCPEFGDI